MAFDETGHAAAQAAIDSLQQVVQGSTDGITEKKALRIVGVTLSNAIKKQLSNPGTGREYRRGNKTHRASAPGHPPAVDTGRLRNSVAFKVGADAVGGFVDVGVSAAYAPYLEYGTSKMAPRPFIRPAVTQTTAAFPGIVADAIAKAQAAAVARMPRVIEV